RERTRSHQNCAVGVFVSDRTPKLANLGKSDQPGLPMLRLHEELLAALVKLQISTPICGATTALADFIALPPIYLAKQSLELLPAQAAKRVHSRLAVEPCSIATPLEPPCTGTDKPEKKDEYRKDSTNDLNEGQEHHSEIELPCLWVRRSDQWRDHFAEHGHKGSAHDRIRQRQITKQRGGIY